MNEKIMDALKAAEEVFFPNPHYQPQQIHITTDPAVEEARLRLQRFAPFLREAFPDTQVNDGLIESPLTEIPKMAAAMRADRPFLGSLWLKQDSELPISGSIKARGGIYEVLHFAEQVALRNGKIGPETDYAIFNTPDMKELLSGYEVSVGSTGNLGLSIGIMSRALGFNVTVHMSADARQWKKDMLRSLGAVVVEYEDDYEKAVAEGRKIAEQDPNNHFVDDENSMDLYVGYAVAGERLRAQLEEKGIAVSESHPLFVYLPCGVGGGPGGVAYGIQNALGPHAHCIFAEPVQAPCMLLSILTQTHGEISVKDIGLSGLTEADGLAVGRASELVSQAMTPRLDALYSIDDGKLLPYLRKLYDTEGIFIEPSSAAGFDGPAHVSAWGQYDEETLKNATHILWATGGRMVPEEEKKSFLGIE